ncbi:stretch-activated Ca2+-permeable channel component-domain-containing protein [Sphaerosporella brunnea]|uniref:Stretch-activated Ca2+-permeable channel component-domain-containing protein n=1 Tax=Sphaerosporella brunnea TaxID=1250544 RepID=A0A5J5ER89_9PEZI|nr:stretch-activated Ca2+-permeable channel component-domain-containing protein [Sphaerosporella brunnea]
MILLLTSLWQRRGRRKPTLDFAAALLLYTLTIALVPPWVGASELLEGSDETTLGMHRAWTEWASEVLSWIGRGKSVLRSRREEENGVLKKREDDGFAELDDRQVRGNKTVHLTFNTCLQPIWNSSDTSTAPPPLQLFFLELVQQQVARPKCPGQSAIRCGSRRRLCEVDIQFLYLVDTDDSTALFITGNMTDHSSEFGGVDEDPANLKNQSFTPYTMYAQNRNVPSRFKGLGKSYCAVRQLANITPGTILPIARLNRSHRTKSHAYPSPFVPRTSIGTERANSQDRRNCQLSTTSPSALKSRMPWPSNPTLFRRKQLMEFYDNGAQQWWANFTYSSPAGPMQHHQLSCLQPCPDCDDCAAAYKTWLCAVTIPRCMDYSANSHTSPHAHRTLFLNASSNGWQKHPWMPVLDDQEVSQWQQSGGWLGTGNNQSVVLLPQPYGFGCPGEGSRRGDVTCSYLGAVYFLSGLHGI